MRAADFLELLALAALIAGVGVIHWPSGLIVAGVLGVVACEYASSRDGAGSERDQERS